MSDAWWNKKLSHLREDVRCIDHEILKLIRKRMDVCIEIGEIKKYMGKQIFDPLQEERVLKDKMALGASSGLNKNFIRKLMRLIMDYSKELQSLNNRKMRKLIRAEN